MPPRKKIDLPDHVRDAVVGDVRLSLKQSVDADENFKIRIYLAIEQGLTTREIADELGIGQTSVSKYANQGKEAYERREQARSNRPGEDPVRSSERAEIG